MTRTITLLMFVSSALPYVFGAGNSALDAAPRRPADAAPAVKAQPSRRPLRSSAPVLPQKEQPVPTPTSGPAPAPAPTPASTPSN